MTTKTVRRRADIPAEEAIQGLIKKFPNARLASFEREGQLFVATLVTAEFPPPSDGDDEESAGPPHPEPDGDEDGGPSDHDGDEPDSDDGGEKKSPPKKDGEGKGGTEHQMLEVLKAIAEALGAPVPGDEGAVPGEHEGPLPPPPGGPAGPPMPPGPPMDKKPPLPPPAAPSGGGLGGLGAPMAKTIVSSIAKQAAGRRSVVVWRPQEDATLKQAAAEIRAELPDFEMRKIERKMGRINGGEPQPVVIAALVRK